MARPAADRARQVSCPKLPVRLIRITIRLPRAERQSEAALPGNPPARPRYPFFPEMIICVCHRVSDRDIAREVAHGCATFDQLQERTRAATGCGACTEFAQECFDAHAGGSCFDRRGCHAGAAMAVPVRTQVTAPARSAAPTLTRAPGHSSPAHARDTAA